MPLNIKYAMHHQTLKARQKKKVAEVEASHFLLPKRRLMHKDARLNIQHHSTPGKKLDNT